MKNKKCRLGGTLLSTWRRLYKNNKEKYWEKMAQKNFAKIIIDCEKISIYDVMKYGHARLKEGIAFGKGLK